MFSSLINKCFLKLSQRIDNSSLIFFRIIFGILLASQSLIYLSSPTRITDTYINPKYLITMDYFNWLPRLSESGFYYLFYGLLFFGVLIAIGLFYRIAISLCFLGFTYILLIDKSGFQNHYYLISLLSFLCILIPLNSNFSIDSLIWPKIKSQTIPFYCLFIILFQVSMVYFWGGITKINYDWLHGYPLKIWIHGAKFKTVYGPLADQDWLPYALSYAGLLFDLTIIPGLIWKRTKVLYCVADFAFCAINYFTFNIGIFPFLAFGSTLLFFSPSWPRKILNVVFKRKKEEFSSGVQVKTISYPTFYFIAGWVIWQMVMPLRPYVYQELYGENVLWTRHGTLYSWRMKLTTNTGGAIELYIKDPVTKKIERMYPDHFLSKSEYVEIIRTPETLLQFVHMVAEERKNQTGVMPEIYVESKLALDGRNSQEYVKSNVDLVKVPYPYPFFKSINFVNRIFNKLD